MGMATLKLFFNIVLMFIVTTAYYESTENIRKCPNSGNLPLAEEKPMDYSIDLEIDMRFKVQRGSVNITVHVKKPTMSISLNLHGLEMNLKRTWIKPIQDKEQENTIQKLYDTHYCPKYDIMILIFGDILYPGQYLLHIEYTSLLNQKLGEIRQSPFLVTGKNEWLFTNLYKSDSLRGLFPCWDDPAVRASFRIKLCYSAGCRAFTNMPAWFESKRGQHNNMTCANFWTSQMKPTSYLAIGLFENVTIHPLSDIINHIWHQSNSTELLEYLHETTTSVMLYFSKLVQLGVHDVIKKIDHVVLPNSLMKSTGRHGLIIYREKDVQYDNNTDLPGKHINIMKLVTYEIARQWFLSSCLDNDMAIKNNELLAAFYSYYAVAQINKDHKYMDLLAVENIQTALDSDVLLDIIRMTDRVNNTDGIDALFHSLLYRKKAFALIRMLLHILTPTNFQEGILKYMHACVLFPDGNENLWDFLQEVYPKHKNHRYTIQEIINSWLSARYHPELRIQRIVGQSKVEYYYYSSFPIKSPETKWKIPITYMALTNQGNINSYNTSDIIWFEFSERKNLGTIKPEDSFIVNLDQMGYYRVNYDSRNWQGIYTYLHDPNKYKNIPVINRAQLINDAYYFTTKGELDISVFLNITMYLRQETDYIAWYPMFNIFARMSKFFDYASSERMKSHFLNILSGLLKNVGYENRPEDDAMMTSLRTLAIKWACKIKIVKCMNAANRELSHYIDYPKSKFDEIPAVMEDWVLCSGISLVDISIWMPLFREAVRYNKKLFKYLACSEDEEIIMHYLNLITSLEYEGQIDGEACRSIIKRHANKDAVLNYVLENHTLIKNRFPLDFPGNDLFYITTISVHSIEQLTKIYNLVQTFDSYRAYYNTSKLIGIRKQQMNKEENAFKRFWGTLKKI